MLRLTHVFKFGYRYFTDILYYITLVRYLAILFYYIKYLSSAIYEVRVSTYNPPIRAKKMGWDIDCTPPYELFYMHFNIVYYYNYYIIYISQY